MKQVLLAYDTASAATADISEIVCREFAQKGCTVDAKLVDDIDAVAPYRAVIVGSPIRLSKCTPKVKKFVKKHAGELRNRPTAFFFTCLSAIDLKNKPRSHIPIYKDPSFDATHRERSDLSYFAYLHTSSYYVDNFLTLIPHVEPVSIAFFKGRLDFTRIRFRQRIFMRIVMRLFREIQPGDFLNPEAARVWAENLYPELVPDHLVGRGSVKK